MGVYAVLMVRSRHRHLLGAARDDRRPEREVSSTLASVPAGGGPGVNFNADLRGISFALHVLCVDMIPNTFLLAWLAGVHFEDECCRAVAY